MTSLPIDQLLPEIVATVERHPLTLLEAEPGAGKTTRVPAALLLAGHAGIYVLEPRRLAARLAARRVAAELGESVGQRIGFQVRFEEVGDRSTSLWFVTEGVLTRKLLANPLLSEANIVVLDEFHERHIETDLALALLRKLQLKRTNLKLLLMSATLGAGDLILRLGGSVPLLRAPGRVFPVSVKYQPPSSSPLEQQVAGALGSALAQTEGHVLVFLPGAAEIRLAAQACEGLARGAGALLTLLHGDLSSAEQDLAVATSDRRKIILSTNVAESSVTIDGVRTVIDSGLARVASYSTWSGFTRLRVERVSKSSAIQRAGRAGRTAPGLAVRLFTEEDFRRRPDHLSPEIMRSDLAQITLDLAATGYSWNDLDWLDRPADSAIAQSMEELHRLGTTTGEGVVTELGRTLSRLPLHPRLGRFLLAAAEKGAGREAATLAAILSEGRYRLEDSARRRHVSDVDALLEVNLSFPARRLAEQLRRALPRGGAADASPGEHAIEKALLVAYSDRVARRRGDTLLLSSGGSAKLDRWSVVESEFLVALDAEERPDKGGPLVRIATPIEPDWLMELFPDRVEARERLEWNRGAERVEEVSQLVFDELVLDETRRPPKNAEASAALLAQMALEAGIERFVDVEQLDGFLARVRFVAQHSKGLVWREDLVEDTLRRLCYGLRSFDELRAAAGQNAFLTLLESALPAREVDAIAPAFVQLASGRRTRIHYVDGQPPWIASRLQDFFGMQTTPVVARGAVSLVVHLLAPNQRPVQMTQDLASFWKNLYPEVRRELSRRYPRHSWPEKP